MSELSDNLVGKVFTAQNPATFTAHGARSRERNVKGRMYVKLLNAERLADRLESNKVVPKGVTVWVKRTLIPGEAVEIARLSVSRHSAFGHIVTVGAEFNAPRDEWWRA